LLPVCMEMFLRLEMQWMVWGTAGRRAPHWKLLHSSEHPVVSRHKTYLPIGMV